MKKPEINNTKEIKYSHISLVKSALKEIEYGTKASISNKTGLSVATCNTILNELRRTGEAIEYGQEKFSGGRPAKQYIFNADYQYLLCLHIAPVSNGGSMTYTVSNLVGQVIETEQIRYHTMDYTHIERIVVDKARSMPLIQSVGIGLPGVVLDGTVIECTCFPELVNIPLKKRLEDKFNVFVDVRNDMSYIAYGFFNHYSHSPNNSSAYLYFPEHDLPGCGIIANDQILEGYTHFAGEVHYLADGNESIIAQAVTFVNAITAVMNPKTIAFAGSKIFEEDLAQIKEGCMKTIPERHIAELIYRDNIHVDYLRGLIDLTIENYEKKRRC